MYCCNLQNGDGSVNPSKKSPGDAFFDHFEAKLKTARNMAFITNAMYSLNWFLGLCSLTWASTVVLGGLLMELTQHDYYSVVVLLVLEAVRLSTFTFFAKLVTWRLAHGSADPQRLLYNDAWRQNLQGALRILEQALQLTVIAVTILLPLRRLQDLNLIVSSPAAMSSTFRNGLKTSLSIFYVLVLVNTSIAGLALIISKNAVPFFVDSSSLRKYYEKIVSKGIDAGLLQSMDFDFLSWTFQMQADEYKRNARAPVVKQVYGDIIKFLYYHRKHKGFEAAKVALDSSDSFEREAAANIVGLWVSLAMEVEQSENKSAFARLRMQTKLLAKLADALDNEESGRAASVSFLTLATHDPEGVLKVRSEGGNEKLADILIDRIHQLVSEMKKPNNAIIYIKAIIPLLPHLVLQCTMAVAAAGALLQQLQADCDCTPTKVLGVLKEDLRTIVEDYAEGLKRLQAVAAHAYYLLLSEDERQQKDADLRRHLLVKPTARNKQHILEDELHYLLKYAKLEELPKEWNGAVTKRELGTLAHDVGLPWLARPGTALAACLANVAILVLSSMFAIKHVHF